MSKFVSSSFWNLSISIFVRSLSFITYPFIVQHFLKEDISVFKAIQAFIMIVFTLVPFGTKHLYISTKEKDRHLVWNSCYLITLLLSVIILILILFVPQFVNYFLKIDSTFKFRLTLSLIPLLVFFKSIFITKLTSNLDFKEISIALMIKQLILYGSIIGFAFFMPTMIALITILLFAELIEVAVLYFYINRNNFSLSYCRKLPLIYNKKDLLSFVSFIGSEQIFNVLAIQFPTIYAMIVMGKELAPEFQLPLYAIGVPTSLIMISVAKVIFPYIVNLESQDKIKETLLAVSYLLTTILFPIFISISFFAEEINSLLFNEEWHFAIFAIRFLPLMLFLNVLNNPLTSLALINKKPYITLTYSISLFFARIFAIKFGYSLFGFKGAVLMFITADSIIRIIRLIIDLNIVKINKIKYLRNILSVIIHTVIFALLLFVFYKILNNKYFAFTICVSLISFSFYFFNKNRIINFVSLIKR